MTRNTRVNLSRQSRFHNTNNFIPTGMLMMDERLHSNLTPDHWGMTTSLHKRRKLGVWNCRKGPFILKKPWCCHWNGICILMTLWRQMMYMVPLPFCFLKTPPFTSHFCTQCVTNEPQRTSAGRLPRRPITTEFTNYMYMFERLRDEFKSLIYKKFFKS